MSIRVKGYLTLRDIIGEQMFPIGEAGVVTLRDILLKLYQQKDAQAGKIFYDPEHDQVGETVNILVNGRNFAILPGQLDMKLEDGDEIAIFPPMAGG